MSEKIRKLKEDASRLIAKARLDEACECYERIVKIDARDLTARQKLAELYGRLGKREQAVECYQSVAGSYAADGLLLKAIAVCKIILQLDPAHTETQNILADLSTRRRGVGAPAGENVVEMPMAMSSALGASGKKIPSQVRGVAADHIRSADHIRGVLGGAGPRKNIPPGQPEPGSLDELDIAANGPPHATLGQSHTSPQEISALQAARQAVLASQAKAAVVVTPRPPQLPLPQPPIPDDLPFDISFDDAEPVVVGNSLPEPPRTAGAPILTAAIASPGLDAGGPEPPEYNLDAADEFIAEVSDEIDVLELTEVSNQVDVDDIPPIPLFSDLPRAAFVALTEKMELRVACVDDVLIQEGEVGTSMFIIIQGRVKVMRTDDGKETVLAELNDGTFFGEMALLSDAPRTASVVATEETMLFEISRDMLAAMAVEHPMVVDVMKKFHKNRLITNLLKTSSIFQPFSTPEKKALIEKFKSQQAPEGTYLITRERPGDGLYVVLSGRCEVLDKNADGREFIIAELRDGDIFGEMSMLWNKDTCASVRAQTTCVVLRLPRQNFSEVIMTHPQILETLSALSDKRSKQNQELKAAGIASDYLV